MTYHVGKNTSSRML